MKEIIKKISTLFMLSIIIVSCNNKDEVNYTPQVYIQPSNITVNILNVTDTDFDVNFNASEDGVVYYSVQRSNVAAPTAESLIRRNTAGTLVNTKADLTASTDVVKNYTNGIYGAYAYSVYYVMTSVDGIASSVMKAEVTTPDTMDPMFLRDASSPSFTATGISPFAPVTFEFTEPVFYQGGDITFTAFNGGSGTGRQVIVNSASVMSMSGASITVDTHGTFQQDDFNIVTWGAGTFKDNAGKDVAALSGFSHYFSTREFTLQEQATLMQGVYDYSTVWYGALNGFYTSLNANNPGAFLQPSGTFDVTLDTSDANGLTLNGINLFNGFNNIGSSGESENLPMILTEDNWSVGFEALGEMENSPSVITTGGVSTYWSNYSSFFGPNAGGWRLGDGTDSQISHYVSLYRSSDDASLDDVDYLYTRTTGTTFARSNGLTVSQKIKRNSGSKAISNPNFGY